jgi:hypothetical protein
MNADRLAQRLTEAAIRETVELHEFFGHWLRSGGAPGRDLARLDHALDAGFRQIGPDGLIRERAAILAWLTGARASRWADFRIEVSDMAPAWGSGDAVLLEYIETQYGQEKMTRRRSSALFRAAPAAPCGVVWCHLQETWLQDAAKVWV